MVFFQSSGGKVCVVSCRKYKHLMVCQRSVTVQTLTWTWKYESFTKGPSGVGAKDAYAMYALRI